MKNPFLAHPLVTREVGRLHVGEPPEAAEAAVRRAVDPKRWKTLTPKQRDQLMEAARESHEANRNLFARVMGGI